MIDPIELLAREDKWFLGCGDGVLFAPPFPLWLDVPGFWDGATVFQHAFDPLFTVSVLDDDGRELRPRALSRRWTPAELTLEYRLTNGVTVTEVRTVHPGGIFVSEWRLTALRRVTLHLIAWTAQDATVVEPASVRWRGSLGFTRVLLDARDTPARVHAELGCTGEAASWGAYLADAAAPHPSWHLTPFPERWTHSGLPRTVRIAGPSDEGTIFAAVHRTVAVDADGASATFAMRLSAAEAAPAAAGTGSSGHHGTLGGASRKRWQELFARAPVFRCSDPYLESYYWYRWYGIWLNAITANEGAYAHTTLCEGIGRRHAPTAGAAPCHVRELRWLSDAGVARDVLRTFLEHQRPDGSLPERVAAGGTILGGPGCADWGGAMLALDTLAPDDGFLAEVYPRLAAHAEWMRRALDSEESGLFDVPDATEVAWRRAAAMWPDRAGDAARLSAHRLKGVDVTAYAFALLRVLARLAPRASAERAADRWTALAERTARAAREAMWDPENGMFSDVDALTLDRIGLPAAHCFYPYAVGLATGEHLAGLERNLLDAERFWTPFPAPSVSAAHPCYDPASERLRPTPEVPARGRVRPEIVSHLVEGLARSAMAFAPHLRPAAAKLLQRFVRMMFHDGELERPNCHEHYDPASGRAIVSLGDDDHQRSWVNDLLLGLVTGIRPHATGVTVDPFPFGLELAEVTGVRARGALLDVRVEGERVTVRVNGSEREGKLGIPMELSL